VATWAGVLATALCPNQGVAQDLDLRGQIRPRLEVRDLGGGDDAVALTNMRVRAAVEAALDKGISVFIQLQDVRIWGEETSTLGDFSADQLDLHQGYVRLPLGSGSPVSVTVGRQETNFGGQRLVGAVGWTPQGRSFDGLRVTTIPEWGRLDLIAYKLRESGVADAPETDLFGAYGVVDVGEQNSLDLYVLYDREAGLQSTDRFTYGSRLAGASGSLTYRGEVSLQAGDRRGADVSAYMVGARVGTSFGDGRGAVALWFDLLSGDADDGDGETKVFDTLFGTNHKFYGFADLFLNIPVHTGGLGLRDLALKTGYELTEALRVDADLHQFDAAESSGFASSSLGQELDVTLRFQHSSQVGLSAGHSIVWSDEALRALGRASGTAHFGYVMLDAAF
ncbi:MAG: alginate export family protein, partial [Gemmatimonadetes bacterium]|nr:alginate export family protein [Gemmatimonadota bacterium]